MTSRWRVLTMVVAVLAVILPACAGDDPSSPPEPRAGETSESVAATASSIAATPSTTSDSTSAPMPPALEPPADPSAWEQRDSLPLGSTTPCCAEPWVVPPSPALPAPSEPLPDGVYAFDMLSWVPGQLRVQLNPFVACTEGSDTSRPFRCESADPEGDEVGVDLDHAIVIPIALDKDVTVGLTGFSCPAGATEWTSTQWASTGVGLEALLTGLNDDYQSPIGMPLANPHWGVSESDILELLRADPASPFAVEPCGIGMGVSWTSADGVGVLLQSLGSSDGHGQGARQPWELVRPATLHVRDGRITLYVDAGYQS